MKYIQAINTGKGFITHQDRELGHFSGHAGNIYAVADNVALEWKNRVNGVEKTLEEAQNICLESMQTNWDEQFNLVIENETDEMKNRRIQMLGERPTSVDLPV
jgi:hypothetical protein